MNSDMTVARKIFAKAIVELCPPEARCLLNRDYVETKIAAGFEEWEAVLDRDPEILRKTCLCPFHAPQPIEECRTTP